MRVRDPYASPVPANEFDPRVLEPRAPSAARFSVTSKSLERRTRERETVMRRATQLSLFAAAVVVGLVLAMISRGDDPLAVLRALRDLTSAPVAAPPPHTVLRAPVVSSPVVNAPVAPVQQAPVAPLPPPPAAQNATSASPAPVDPAPPSLTPTSPTPTSPTPTSPTPTSPTPTSPTPTSTVRTVSIDNLPVAAPARVASRAQASRARAVPAPEPKAEPKEPPAPADDGDAANDRRLLDTSSNTLDQSLTR